ncbi:MAG: hypothetical protein K2Y17_03985 [Qipengyuania sp.]|nr:hypothetical protein [Qipengyuania sp.]
MNAITLTSASARVNQAVVGPFRCYEDPLEPDEVHDVVVSTSRRGLTRLALVAAETGARFQREAVGHDPMAWLLSTRRLFNGDTALEACLEREPCLRAILLHGLSLGLDATPASIDALLADDPSPDRADEPWSGGDRESSFDGAPGSRRLRLYSATIVVARGGELLHAFHASIAPSAAVVRERIRVRFGSAAAAQAEIRVGFDPDCPATLGMVPPAIVDTLTQAGRRPRRPSLAGLDITVEQRLSS